MKTSFASKEIFETLTADKDKYKVVILIIASISESYNLFVECWKEYMNLFPEVKCYFLYSDPTIEADMMVYDNILVYKAEESFVPGIFQKTVSAMNFCQKYFNYEYIVRTNLSTFIHIPRLLNYLSDKPKENYVGGHYNQLPAANNQVLKQTLVNTYLKKIINEKFIYMHGTGMIFSSDVVEKFLNELKVKYDDIQAVSELPDDVLISLITYGFLTLDEYTDTEKFYRPVEFINICDYKIDCCALVKPTVFDDNMIFLVRNKIVSHSNKADIETRYNDLMNYIHQIRYFYNKPTFMDYIDEPPTKRVVDCFSFDDELDLLEYRLNILNDSVDHFVIVESTKTYMGVDKPLYYSENKARFSKFEDKIVHIVVDDLVVPDIESGGQWNNEKHQRNYMHVGIEQLELADYDYIIISDVYEIPDPVSINDCKNSNAILPFANLNQTFYYYNLNTLNNEVWIRPKIVTHGEYVKLGSVPSKIRLSVAPSTVRNGGWNLSYFGDAAFISNKIKNLPHQEFNTEEITDEKNIQRNIDQSTDIFNRATARLRQVSIADNGYLPPKYDEYLAKFVREPAVCESVPQGDHIQYEISEIEEPEPEPATEPEPTSEPVEELATESVEEVVTEPVEEVVTESVEEPVAEPAAESIEEVVTEPASEPAAESVEEVVTAAEPTEEHVAEPTEEAVTAAVSEPATEPAAESVEEVVTEPASEPAAESVEEVVTEPASEPAVQEPDSEPAPEPVAEVKPVVNVRPPPFQNKKEWDLV